MSVVDKIRHYQRNLEKCYDNEDRILHCISKLYKLPVTVQHLQETGVGRTVNSLRKYDGNVGDAAKALVFKWKVMVADEYSSDGEEDEACIPDVPEDHSDNYTSPKLENTEENTSSLADQSSESKLTHKHKETKSEPFTKHSMMHLSKLKVEEEKHEKHEKHEKNKHSSKHHSKSDKKSKESKSSDNSLKIEEASSLTKYSHSKMDNSRKINDKITEDNEEINKKRKQDNSDSSKKEIKKRKLSDSKSDDEKSQLSISGKNDSHLKSSNVQIEVKIEMADLADKQSVKQEAEEKPSSSSSSSKSKSKQPSTAKDSTEKQKHKNKEHTSHKKSHIKKDSNQHSSKELSKSQASSSSSKDHDKSKNRSQKKERKDDRDEKKKETKIKLMQDINGDEGIDCNSGASFAEALGMCTMPQSSKKRHTISPNLNSNKSIKIESPPLPINNRKTPVIKTEPECDESPNSLSLLASNVKLEPLSVDLVSTLPEISPNYKPLPYINPIHRKEEIKAFDEIIYVKNQRTKVYSGNKVGYTTVPTLYDMCIRVLIENIDALEFTGGVPFDILKPVLERATADQLFMLEHYNPYLMEDTDVLWQFHANREFKKNVRQEMESWREMYMRCLDEREAKLKTLTANIKQSIDKSIPVRSTKLAYVDNIVKPPRNILKKQAKYGTANAIPATVSSVKKKLTVGGGATNATNIAVPPPPMSRFKASTSSVKKTKAPLMAKALQLIKGRYKR